MNCWSNRSNCTPICNQCIQFIYYFLCRYSAQGHVLQKGAGIWRSGLRRGPKSTVILLLNNISTSTGLLIVNSKVLELRNLFKESGRLTKRKIRSEKYSQVYEIIFNKRERPHQQIRLDNNVDLETKRDNTVAKWLALPPGKPRVLGLNPNRMALVPAICMFFLCPCGFPLPHCKDMLAS